MNAHDIGKQSPDRDCPPLEMHCPKCACSVIVPCVREIDSEDGVMELIEGRFNRAGCPDCGGLIEADVPVMVRIPDSLVPSVRYVPFHTLECPDILDSILEEDPAVRVVYSMGEMERVIEAGLLLARHRQSRTEP